MRAAETFAQDHDAHHRRTHRQQHREDAGARRWRQVWSDHKLKAMAPAEVSALARRGLQARPPADTIAAFA